MSSKDPARKTVVYFFDEMGLIPDQIFRHFVKGQKGYAVFATSTIPRGSSVDVTPPELVKKTLVYHSPASPHALRSWLASQLGKLLKNREEFEVTLATDLLLNLTGGHIGIIQFLGKQLEDSHCASVMEVRDELWRLLTDGTVLFQARCFGVQNGVPDAEQSELISMLRCSGNLTFIDSNGKVKPAFDLSKQSHRDGLTKAFYAPVSLGTGCISKLGESATLGFVHALQPELYYRRFQTQPWLDLSLRSRWVRNFAHTSAEEPCSVPTNAIDLVISWLSHISSADLLYAHHNLDPSEATFQRSFDQFRLLLGMKGGKEVSVGQYGDLRGFLDHLVEDNMGIELLIRSTKDNCFSASGLLQSDSPTRTSLRLHAARATFSYANTAAKCSKGYVTVLLATLTFVSYDAEWENFKGFVKELAEDAECRGSLDCHIMVAASTFGWADFQVFLHQPGQDEPIQFTIPRQRLMYKLVDSNLKPARHFYPRPMEVWVQRLLSLIHI